jgi:hypothetical protein
LTGWERVKPGTSKNVYICVKMKASLPFSRLKHCMIPFLSANKMYMQRNHSLGDSSEEMATIGYLSPAHPDLLLAHIQTELNKEFCSINAQKDDNFLAEHGVHRGVHGEIVIAHGAVRGSSEKQCDVVNSKAVIVECPRSKMGYYVQTVQEALRSFQWSPDMKQVKFVPFALKADVKTKEIFTNMIVYNSLENNKKTFSQVLGVSLDNMLEIRDVIIEGCPYITHIDPTPLTAKQGRWKIYTSKAKLDTIEKWLTENLARMVESLDMSIPVPGFQTPRLFVSNRISTLHVQEIKAIAMTVPNIEDASAFPNLVIRNRSNIRQGAWTSSPKVINTAVDRSYLTHDVRAVTPSTRTQPNLPFTDPSPTSPIMMGVYKQLEEKLVGLSDAIVKSTTGNSESIYLATINGKQIDPQSSPTNSKEFQAYVNWTINLM